MLEKNIFILWLQGWEHAPWLCKEVAESWRFNNPGWNIHLISQSNLIDYVPVSYTPYLYDKNKTITSQARSDIIRLSVLARWGGVWADATMLCMQPLDHWIQDAVAPGGLWMYHGHGAQMAKEEGPASWFILSIKGGDMITKWKAACDHYWTLYDSTNHYFFMDGLFRELYLMDADFAALWQRVPYLYCELDGQSHTLSHHGMEKNTPHIKQLFEDAPPYALKFWSYWDKLFPDVTSNDCQQSNGYFAIQMAKRRVRYRHLMSQKQPKDSP